MDIQHTIRSLRKAPILIALLLFSLAHEAWSETGPLLRRIYQSSADYPPTLDQDKKVITARSNQSNVSIIKLDLERLSDTSVSIELPDNSTTILNRIEYNQHPTYTSWSGSSVDGGVVVALILEGGKLSGKITTRLKIYRLEQTSENSIASIYEVILPKQFERGGKDVVIPPPATTEQLQREKDLQKRSKAASSTTSSSSAPPVTANAVTKRIIDVMVVTTFNSRMSFGGETPSNSRIRSEIVDANVSFSEFGAELRLVDIYPLLLFNESSNISDTLHALQALKEVQDRRDQVGADIVIGWIDTNPTECGVASLGPNQIYAYAVVTIRDWCLYNRTFAHEIGHLFGADHEQENAKTTVSYAHGWPSSFNNITYNNSSGTLFVMCDTDLMGYSLQAQKSYCGGTSTSPYFSNPNRNIYFTAAARNIQMGSSTQNNALQVSNTISTVQNFRTPGQTPGTETTSTPVKVRAIIDFIMQPG